MDNLKREYDRFGPWVAEIKEEIDIPPQFSDFKTNILKSDLSLKIPVFVDRRNLKPGMLLYSTVVCITGDLIVILHHGENSIDQQEISLKSLQYFQSTLAILLGELKLVTPQQTAAISYNPVDPEPVEKLMALIRQRYCDAKPSIDLDKIPEQEHDQSFLYEALLAKEMKKEQLKTVAYQPAMKLGKGYVSMMRRWQVVTEEYGLQDSLFLTNGTELIVLNRVQDMKAVQKSDYGYRYSYIPLKNIRTLLWEPDEVLQGIRDLSIVTEDSRLVFKVEEHFPVEPFRETLGI